MGWKVTSPVRRWDSAPWEWNRNDLVRVGPGRIVREVHHVRPICGFRLAGLLDCWSNELRAELRPWCRSGGDRTGGIPSVLMGVVSFPSPYRG